MGRGERGGIMGGLGVEGEVRRRGQGRGCIWITYIASNKKTKDLQKKKKIIGRNIHSLTTSSSSPSFAMGEYSTYFTQIIRHFPIKTNKKKTPLTWFSKTHPISPTYPPTYSIPFHPWLVFPHTSSHPLRFFPLYGCISLNSLFPFPFPFFSSV